MAFTFDPLFAADPNNPNVIAKNATITIFDPADATKAPITITDPTGSPLPNPITVDAFGMGPAFQHATLERVGWFGAGFTNYFTSYEGMKAVATAAQTAAEASAASAATAGSTAATAASAALADAVADAEAAQAAAVSAANLVGAPADSAIATAVTTPGTATATALSATFVTKLRPLGGGADDRAQINAALNAARPAGAYGTVALEGDFFISGPIAVPDYTTVDARAATITALPNCGYLVQTKAMDNMLLAPRELTATPSVTGGTLAANTYYYRVSAVTTAGETIASVRASAVVTGTTGSVALKWRTPRVGPLQTITQYKIWRGTPIVGTLLATINAVNPSFDQDVFWTDTGASTGTAGAFPVINTTFGRTKGITILGGVWDGSRLSNPSGGEGWQASRYIGHGFNLQKVDDITIKDSTLVDIAKWGIAIADWTNLVTRDLKFDTNSDGIHVLGPGKGWQGHGFYGHVGDDLVGLSLVEWPNQTASEGNITGVDLSGFHGVDAPSAVRMLMGSGRKFDSIKIRDVRGEYTQYRDATGNYTNPGVGVVFLNSDQNNPDRKGGTFGNVVFEDIVPDAHQTDVLQVDGAGDTIIAKNIVSNQSTRHAVRVGTQTYDVTRPTDIKKVVVDDARTKHANASRSVYVGQLNTSLGDLIVNRPDASLTGVSTAMPVDINNATIQRLRVNNPLDTNDTVNGMDLVQLTNATCLDIVVNNPVASKINTVVYLNNGTYGSVLVTGGSAATMQAIVKSKTPANIKVRDTKVDTLSSGVVALFTATATPVTVEYSGLSLTAAAGLFKDGSQVVNTGGSLGTQVDLSKVAKVANSMAYNTNAALSCGVGPVVSDGTNWKHLFTGATY